MSSRLICNRCGHTQEGEPGVRCPEDGLALLDESIQRRYPDDPMLGRVIGGKYPLIDVIGSGGMGSVYRGIQEPVGREVAVKVIRRDEQREAVKARFFREARVVARLRHGSTVTLFDYGEAEDGLLYMILEYIRGRSLKQLLRGEGPQRPERVLAFGAQILGALGEAHRLDLVHRDLKPANIMLTEGPDGEERVKVLDFGIAKVSGFDETGSDSIETREGIVLGTPRYMAPEQALGRGIGPHTDVYSVGVLLYELLCGRTPYQGHSSFEVLMAHAQKPVPPIPAEIGCPPELEAICRRALSKKPDDRYRDASEMGRALRAIIGSVASVTNPNMEALPPPGLTGQHAVVASTAPPPIPVPGTDSEEMLDLLLEEPELLLLDEEPHDHTPGSGTSQEMIGELSGGLLQPVEPAKKSSLTLTIAALAGAAAVGLVALFGLGGEDPPPSTPRTPQVVVASGHMDLADAHPVAHDAARPDAVVAVERAPDAALPSDLVERARALLRLGKRDEAAAALWQAAKGPGAETAKRKIRRDAAFRPLLTGDLAALVEPPKPRRGDRETRRARRRAERRAERRRTRRRAHPAKPGEKKPAVDAPFL